MMNYMDSALISLKLILFDDLDQLFLLVAQLSYFAHGHEPGLNLWVRTLETFDACQQKCRGYFVIENYVNDCWLHRRD